MYFPGATACSLSTGLEVPWASRAVTSTGMPGFGRAGSWRTSVASAARAAVKESGVVTPRTIRARVRIGEHPGTAVRETRAVSYSGEAIIPRRWVLNRQQRIVHGIDLPIEREQTDPSAKRVRHTPPERTSRWKPVPTCPQVPATADGAFSRHP